MSKLILIIFIFCLPCFLFSQQVNKKEYTTKHIDNPPKIDAVPDDSCWMNIPVTTDFIQTTPNPGLPMSLNTEVKMVYDGFAIYFLAIMYDSSPDSILRELSKRDNVFFGPNTDAFGVLIDAWQDGRNALFFGVTAAGVQTDTRIHGEEDFDDSWNVVWDSKVKINTYGWVVEMKIPYSAIRFPKKESQEWNLNFARQIKRYNEFGNWQPVNPEIQGFIHQSGILKGISNIDAPLRLSFSPYISAYTENYQGKNSYLFNGGADVKYGINESFTLDMTLIPDFGQVRSDDKVLNLSPFEVRYDEQRSFFTEGTELFNRGNLFYSRRIGGTPLGFENVYDQLGDNEEVTDNPSAIQLYNATKISGRTNKKLGIGFFNAITAPSSATITNTLSESTRKILTQPMSNYNVIVFDQTLKNNSYASIINTNVLRKGSSQNANVTGLYFQLNNKNLSYGIEGDGTLSRTYKPGSINNGLDSMVLSLGHRYKIDFSKRSGNFTFDAGYFEKSNTYDPNDLGYLENNNEAGFWTDYQYKIFKPFWKINNLKSELQIEYNMLFLPRTYSSFNTGINFEIEFVNFAKLEGNYNIYPFKSYDFYEPRVEGRYFVYAPNQDYGLSFTSDYRKAFSFEINVAHHPYNERNRNIFSWSLSPRYRFSNKFNMNYSFYSANKNDDVGFVDIINDTIIFGVRDVNTFMNTIEGNYIFTSTMSLSLRTRHYWSQVKYKEYFALNEDGELSFTSYNSTNDINFNVFTVDLAYTWQFLPGSEMSIVWKNSILKDESLLVKNYFENLNETLNSPQLNSFSIKVLYYLDYLSLKKKAGKQ